MQGDVVTLRPRLILPPQYRRIVAAHLGAPRAVRRCAVEIVQDQTPHGVHAVVDAGGQHVDTECVFLWRGQAKLRAGAVDLRAHVHGGTGVVRREPLGVEGDGGAAGVDEQLLGHGRNRDELGAVLHADGVAVGAEDLDGGVTRGAEGLEPLVGLLAVVEGRGHAVYADVRVGDELERGPLAGLVRVVGLDVAVDWRENEGSAGAEPGRGQAAGRSGKFHGLACLLACGSQCWPSRGCSTGVVGRAASRKQSSYFAMKVALLYWPRGRDLGFDTWGQEASKSRTAVKVEEIYTCWVGRRRSRGKGKSCLL